MRLTSNMYWGHVTLVLNMRPACQYATIIKRRAIEKKVSKISRMTDTSSFILYFDSFPSWGLAYCHGLVSRGPHFNCIRIIFFHNVLFLAQMVRKLNQSNLSLCKLEETHLCGRFIYTSDPVFWVLQLWATITHLARWPHPLKVDHWDLIHHYSLSWGSFWKKWPHLFDNLPHYNNHVM